MVSDLRAARRRKAGSPAARIIVVTLDPWRDTPERLPALAREWGLDADDRVLSGSVADVERALDALGIGRQRIEQNGDIEHVGAAMILDARGRTPGGSTGRREERPRSSPGSKVRARPFPPRPSVER